MLRQVRHWNTHGRVIASPVFVLGVVLVEGVVGASLLEGALGDVGAALEVVVVAASICTLRNDWPAGKTKRAFSCPPETLF